MAWVEKRANGAFRVYWREGGRGSKRDWETFDSREHADAYKLMVNEAGQRRPAPIGQHAPKPVAGRPCTFEQWADYWYSGYSGPNPRTRSDNWRTVQRDFLPLWGDV